MSCKGSHACGTVVCTKRMRTMSEIEIDDASMTMAVFTPLTLDAIESFYAHHDYSKYHHASDFKHTCCSKMVSVSASIGTL